MTPAAPDTTGRTADRIALVCLVPLALLIWRFDFVCDDAFISFRYSKNLAAGLGLAFNPGVEPPVEGYTNLLWVLWCSIPERLGLDTGLWARASLAVCSTALLFGLVRLLAGRVGLVGPGQLLVALTYACFPPVGLWSSSGLETMAFTAAYFLAFQRLVAREGQPRYVQAAPFLVAACLLRSDGFVWGAMLTGALWGGGLWGSRPELRRAAYLVAGVVGLTAALNIAWRLSYHGDWMPNTAHVKLGFGALSLERGGKYALTWLLQYPLMPLALALGATHAWRRRDGVATASVLVALGALAYVTAIGGDFLPMGRFVMPSVPFAFVALGAAVAAREEGGPRLRVAPAALAAVAALLSLLPAYGHTAVPGGVLDALHYNWNDKQRQSDLALWRGEVDRAAIWRDLGRALAIHAEPDDSLVTASVGAIGYHCHVFLYDQYGLVSREVAAEPAPEGRRLSAGHDKFVAVDYFEPFEPTFMSARIVAVDANGELVRQPRSNRRPRYHSQLFPLDPADGFEAGTALQVMRLKPQ